MGESQGEDLRGNEYSVWVKRLPPPHYFLIESIIKNTKIMVHNYQKRWLFTWNIDENGPLVDEKKLQNLLNEIVEEGVFQKERGKKLVDCTCKGVLN